MCKTQRICTILAYALLIAVIITVGFLFLYPKPTVPQLFNTRITLTYSPQEITPGETVTINGTLEYRDDAWLPLPNKDVNLYYAEVEGEEWNPIGTATTETDGEYRYEWTVNLPLGEYLLNATYAGDERYRPCEAITYRLPRGLLVIPETQAGSIATLTCMFIALIIIRKKHL